MARDLVGETGAFECNADFEGCCNTRAPFDPVGSDVMPRNRPAFERSAFPLRISSGAIQAFDTAAHVEAGSVFLRRSEMLRGCIDRRIAMFGHSCQGKMADWCGKYGDQHVSLDARTDPGGA